MKRLLFILLYEILTQCPPGFKNESNVCVPYEDTFGEDGILCLPGQFCTIGNPDYICPKGSYSSGGTSACDSAMMPQVASGGNLLSCSPSSFCHHDSCHECTPCSDIINESTDICTSDEISICDQRTYRVQNNGQYSCQTCTTTRYKCGGAFFGELCSAPNKFRDEFTDPDECPQCPAGYECEMIGDTYRKTECSEGYYSTGGTTCEPCPAKKVCTTTGIIGTCSDNSYSLIGSTHCSPCPVGYECSGDVPNKCTDGTYSAAGEATCSPCPARKICTGSALPQYCPTGQKTENNVCVPEYDQTAGSACKPGWSCDAATGENFFPCSPGDYETGGECTKCPIGKRCPFPEYTVPVDCENGYYAPEVGMTNCLPCPVGYSCNASSATKCADGSYSIEAHLDCSECPAGYYCSEALATEQFALCAVGTYSEAGSSSCTTCPSGSYCMSGFKYQCPSPLTSTTGAERCEMCPAGYSCTNGYEQCRAGEYSPINALECSACPKGFYCPVGGDLNGYHVIICPKGHYCLGGLSAPDECLINTYGPKMGIKQPDDCVECPAGYHCPSGTTVPGQQNICQLGHYCPAGGNPIPCPAGKFGSIYSLTSASDCEPCQPGRICALGSIYGQPCPQGHFCPKSGQSDAIACPPGTYYAGTGAKVAAKCTYCPVGHFCCDPNHTEWNPSTGVTNPVDSCAGGVVTPIPCRAGSYQSRDGQMTCDYCAPGMRCTEAGLSLPDETCEAGKFCPLGTAVTGVPCPAGTYLDYTNGTIWDDCINCPAGYYCNHNDGVTYMDDSRHPTECPVGNYCLERTPESNTYPCPKGTFSTKLRLKSSMECTNCTAGYFCPLGLGVEPDTRGDLVCPEGHFCPEGTGGETADDDSIPACPSGTFLDTTGALAVEDCKECPQGEFCDAGTSGGVSCGDGYYSDAYGIASIIDCIKCPAGYRCSTAEADPVLEPLVCGTGYYSASGSSVCEECLLGHYCDLNTTTRDAMAYFKVCPEGTFCPAGTEIIPDLVSNGCSLGMWCAKGDVKSTGGKEQPCPVGTYGTRTGLTNMYECEKCPAGVYCPNTGSTCSSRDVYDDACDWEICAAGHYCETGSSVMMPCGAGFYRSESSVQAAVNQTSCSLCESGHYCDLLGMSIPTECPEGSYCPSGSIIPELCDAGTFGNSTKFRTSQECIPCSAGYYCPERGMTEAVQLCSAGFYCKSGSKTKNPQDGVTGDLCPKGQFCPEGSSSPQSCEPGLFTPFEGATKPDDCIECYPGYYCPGDKSMSQSRLPCEPGYYCPSGTKNSDDLEICPVGHSCPQVLIQDPDLNWIADHYIGAIHPTPCKPGTYSAANGRDECDACPAGQFCPTAGLSDTFRCPQGHYCNVESIAPNACPIGTYNPDNSQPDINSCRQCIPGHYCNSRGLAFPTGLCPDGYDCYESGIVNPFQEKFKCPKGSVCSSINEGPVKTTCPAGTFNPREYGQPDDCLQCTPGMACTTVGLSEPDSLCAEKYYCQGGADRTTPSGEAGKVKDCEYGYYCGEGSPAPMPCPIGTYDDTATGPSIECESCSGGLYCTGTIPSINPFGAPQVCPRGEYCEGDGTETPLKCPRGTYSNKLGLENVVSCTACPEGSYCPEPGQQRVEDTHTCADGYYCAKGSSSATPLDGICNVGSYCKNGLIEDCPIGTIGTAQFLADESECTQCPGGYFCDRVMLWDDLWNNGAYNESMACEEGYFCKSGCTVSNPTSASQCSRLEALTGGTCSRNSYCPKASMGSIPCPVGQYQPSTKSSQNEYGQCEDCPEGYQCKSSIRIPCPKGYYCKGGTEVTACPAGTYNNVQRATDDSFCLSCRAGFYCPEHGMSLLGDYLCSEGFYCTGGTIHKKPNEANGSYCPIGSYCPEGSSEPKLCDLGKYCDTAGAAMTSGDCAAGYYCEEGSKSATPFKDGIPVYCPEGYHCPAGINSPLPCGAGKWSPVGWERPITGLRSESECLVCPAGFYCDGNEPSSGDPPEPIACQEGYYCPSGSHTVGPSGSTDCGETNICPLGHFCPSGSEIGQPCPHGYYNDRCGQSDCKTCPAGRFCNQASVAGDAECQQGSFCPSGTGSPIPCPPGQYGSSTNLPSADRCTRCDPGYYCEISANVADPSKGLTSPTDKCSPGYFCISGSTTPNPNDGITGSMCPLGYYCTNSDGVTEPEPCPVGTYGDRGGLTSSAGCLSCPAGFDCQSEGISAETLMQNYCEAGSYCLAGQSTGLCQEEGRYCPTGSYTENGFACPEGTWSNARDPSSDNFNSNCFNCPARFVCDYDPGTDTTTKEDCPGGFYCQAGSTSKNAQGCPSGTYGASTGLQYESDCHDCPAGFYCPYSTGPLNGPQPPTSCFDGYACIEGSTIPSPDGADGLNRPCNPGHYCTAGIELECPEGTFLPTTHGETGDECIPCPGGLYCPGNARVNYEENLKCSEGYFCYAYSSSYRPATDEVNGNYGICPPGHYCPEETARPIPCPYGFFSEGEGNIECTGECSAGYLCPAGSILSNDPANRCPLGYYCEEGTTPWTIEPCPKGYYDATDPNDTIGLQVESDCTPCPPGYYCQMEASVAADLKKCENGYFCSNDYDPGSWSSRPYCDSDLEDSVFCNKANFGGICPPGSVCDEGVIAPEPCPENKYCPNYGHFTGNLEEFDCAAGYHCSQGSSVLNPSYLLDSETAGMGTVCPEGMYCESGKSPISCPSGYYNPRTGIKSVEECLECPPGTVCTTNEAENTLTQENCPAGKYCLAGNMNDCTLGYICPEGTHIEHPCLSGQYHNGSSIVCGVCPEGFYCDGVTKETEADVQNAQTITSPVACEAGYFCDEATKQKHQNSCPIGTSSDGSECLPCPAGTHCPSVGTPAGEEVNCAPGFECKTGSYSPYGETDDTPTETPCPIGHYCVTGTPIKCPAGTYRNVTRAAAEDDCYLCPAGFQCESEAATTIEVCPVGQFCPADGYCEGDFAHDCEIDYTGTECPIYTFCVAGSAIPATCPYGTYNNDVAGSDTCLNCTGGICENGQQQSNCLMGSFCTNGTAIGCPAGTYGTGTDYASVDECIQCDVGFYCSTSGRSSTTGMCAAGYVCTGGAILGKPEHSYEESTADITLSGFRCPAGHYCEQDNPEPIPCPEGTFRRHELGSNLEDCRACSSGYYCDLKGMTELDESKKCSQGFYCHQGAFEKEPTNDPDGFFGICPIGHYCDGVVKLACPGGTFQPNTGEGSCEPCKPGFYCPDGDVVSVPCPAGAYCLGSNQVPEYCDIGFYSDQLELTSDECNLCPGGQACPIIGGTSDDFVPCEAGYYCPEGSTSQREIICDKGFYCPTEFPEAIVCDAGKACSTTGLSEPNYDCFPGFYCPVGSVLPDINLCPQGHFCPLKSENYEENACTKGTYNPYEGQLGDLACLPCKPGFYCPYTGMTDYSDNVCTAGYWCEAGTIIPENKCPMGSSCPEGSIIYRPCQDGYYTDQIGMDECIECQAGSFCSNVTGLGSTGGEICPQGFFCPDITHTPEPCPRGTIGEEEGLTDSSECISCPDGFYCTYYGATVPTGKCAPGYYCPPERLTFDDPMPSDYICPEQHYCLSGSTEPTFCSTGTFRDRTGGRSESSCPKCPAGYYCEGFGVEPQPCEAGYICENGATVPDPMVTGDGGYICPTGHYCPELSIMPLACPAGTYGDETGLALCDELCEEGFYCPIGSTVSNPRKCAPGYFCPEGSKVMNPQGNICNLGAHCPEGSASPEPCAPGTYSAVMGATECVACPDGMQCNGGELEAATTEEIVNIWPCKSGHYCTNGIATPCPAGTFTSILYTKSKAECVKCPAGYFCLSGSSGYVDNRCPARYYCPAGTNSPVPFNTGCPVGYACPEGVSSPIPCDEGYISSQALASECVECQAGTYCPRSKTTNTTEEVICPAGYYCGTASKYKTACPAGTYNPNSGGRSLDDCLYCPEGFYCDKFGVAETDSKACDDGYHCILGSKSPRPGCQDKHDGRGEVCPLGYYCEAGLANRCPAGKLCDQYGQKGIGTLENCPEGYYCPEGTISEADDIIVTDTDVIHPIKCGLSHHSDNYANRENHIQKGVYCPEGVGEPRECDMGTWSMSIGSPEHGFDGLNCIPCPEGVACTRTGIYNVLEEGIHSSAGYFLSSQGAVSNKPDQADIYGGKCSTESYCPTGAVDPISCEPGYHQPSEGRASCIKCSSGKYCPGDIDSKDRSMQPCTEGHYCPSESSQPIPCPLGTYGIDGTTSYKSISNCRSCTAGKFCDGEGLLQSSIENNVCAAGYYCSGGAKSERPNERPDYNEETRRWENNGKCPIGYYCLAESSEPRICPEGTFGILSFAVQEIYEYVEPYNDGDSLIYAHYLKGCYPCPAGYFCETAGMTTGDPNLPNGPKLCPEGSFCPRGSSRSYRLCQTGHYCSEGTPIEVPCPPGQYQNEPGKTTCKICPAGYYCSSFSGTAEPVICSAGNFCPVGSLKPTPCRPGFYNPDIGLDKEETSCQACPLGFFCPHFGMDLKNDKVEFVCKPGYLCFSRSTSSDPFDQWPEGEILNQSANGPCAPGYYCPNIYNAVSYNAQYSPVECPRGTYNPSTHGMTVDDCLPCRSGYYCADKGLSQPTDLCDVGYYCTSDSYTVSPKANICPVNSYCPAGSGNPIPCWLGYYQLQAGSGECLVCPEGSYCPRASQSTDPIKPIMCNSLNNDKAVYCPEGSEYEHPCPPGTYTSSGNALNLTSINECNPCPRGLFCQEGRIQGPCAGGYLCYGGADAPNPSYGVDENGDEIIVQPTLNEDGIIFYNLSVPLDSDGNCAPGYICSGPCPPGFYCFTNTLTDLSDIRACPTGTYRGDYGGSSPASCRICPAGYDCREGDGNLYPCPPGNYCPSWYIYTEPKTVSVYWQGPGDPDGGRFIINTAPGPILCPKFTYNSTGYAATIDQCQFCPPGYFCDAEGVGSLEGRKCPAGYYCLGQGVPPRPCPAGRMSDENTRAESLLDCRLCPGGRYCPEPNNPNFNTEGILCPVGYQCQPGNRLALLCKEGRYCPREELEEGDLCPAGYFCPQGTQDVYNTNYGDYKCHFPEYCPPGSPSPLSCDLGFGPISSPDGELRWDVSKLCILCPAGTHRSLFQQEQCEPCTAGYFCPPGTSDLSNNICYEGHECPLGGKPTVVANFESECSAIDGLVCCKSGRYDFCYDQSLPIPCQPGTYSFGTGNEECSQCSPNTYNSQLRLASCYNCGHSSTSPAASTSCDCLGDNRVFQIADASCVCDIGYKYDSQSGMDASDDNSRTSCSKLYVGRCDSRSSVTQVCDTPCPTDYNFDDGYRLCLPTGVAEIMPNDCCITLQYVYDPDLGAIVDNDDNIIEVTSSMFNLEASLAKINASGESVTFSSQVVTFNSDGIFGLRYPTSGRRRRENEPIMIADPIVCIKPGEVMIFNLDLSDRNSASYPIYARNSELNTNPAFDYGEFRLLEHYITRTTLQISQFFFTFGPQPSDNEIYTFTDSQDAEKFFLVQVSTECGKIDNEVQPISEASLARAGVEIANSFPLEPNWPLIIGLVTTAVILIIIGVILLLFFDPFGWEVFSTKRFQAKYKELSDPFISENSKKINDEKVEKMKPYVQAALPDELEDFNVRHFLDKLHDQRAMITAQLGTTSETINNFGSDIKAQTETLRKAAIDIPTAVFKKSEVNVETDGERTKVGNDPDCRQPGHLTDREDLLFKSMQDLLNKMHAGRLVVSDEAIKQATKMYAASKADDLRSSKFAKELEIEKISEHTVEEVMKINQADASETVHESGPLKGDTRLIKKIVNSDPEEMATLFDQYEVQQSAAEMRREEDRANRKWHLQQRLKRRLRRTGLKGDGTVEEQIAETEVGILDEKLGIGKEEFGLHDASRKKLRSEQKMLVKNELEKSGVDTSNIQDFFEKMNRLNAATDGRESYLMEQHRSRLRRRRERKIKNKKDLLNYDPDTSGAVPENLVKDIEQIKIENELEELEFNLQIRDLLDSDEDHQRDKLMRDYVTSAASNKSGADVIAILDRLKEEEIRAKNQQLGLKQANAAMLNARLAEQIRKRNESIIQKLNKEYVPPILTDETYSEFSELSNAAETIPKMIQDDKRMAEKLEADYQMKMERLDGAEIQEMDDLEKQLSDDKLRMNREIAQRRHDLVKSMTSEQSERLLAEYEAACNEMKEKQHQEDMRRRFQLQIKLAEKRKQREKEIKYQCAAKLEEEQDNNKEILEGVRINALKRRELDVIEAKLEKNPQLSPLDAIKSVVKGRHDGELQALEAKFMMQREVLLSLTPATEQAAVLAEWEYAFNQDRIVLKNRQNKEIMEYLEIINPVAYAKVRDHIVDMDNQRLDLISKNNKLDERYRNESERLARDIETDINENHKAQDDSLTEELEVERRLLEHEFETSNIQTELMAEKDAELAAARSAGATQLEIDALIEKWAEINDVNQTRANVERLKQRKMLTERIEGQKNKNLTEKMAILEQTKRLKQDELKNEHLIKKSEILGELEELDKKQKRETENFLESITDEIELETLSEEEFNELLNNSSLFSVVRLLKKKLPSDPIKDMVDDDKIVNELIPCKYLDLNRTEKTALKFAQLVLGLLVTKGVVPPVSVLVAEAIPNNVEMKMNAFRKLYSYDSTNRIVYVKRSVLSMSPGFSSVTLQHACAHVKIHDLRNDNDPRFRTEFYKIVSSISSFLFYALSNPDVKMPNAYKAENTDFDFTISQYVDSFKLPKSLGSRSERLESINYKIAMAERANETVEDLRREQQELQMDIKRAKFHENHESLLPKSDFAF